MKNRILLIGLMLAGVMGITQPSPLIHKHFEETDLRAALKALEQDYDLSFSYDEELLSGKSITTTLDSLSLSEALRKMLMPHLLDFEVLREKFVLITQDLSVPPLKELCGRIQNNSREDLPFAQVFLKTRQIGTVGQADGSFSFRASLLPRDTLVVKYVGYETQYLLPQALEGCPTIRLFPKDIAIEHVVISEYLTTGIEQQQLHSALRLVPRQMGVLPGLVEPDILQGTQLLPGVSSPEETASGVYIRGGTPDQNLVLWDGIPMYQTGHFYGMISAFNPYIVEEVQVYRGAFDASYGNRVSGVIDMKTHQRIPDSLQGGVGLNMTHGNVYVKTPLVKNKLGLTLSLRRSLMDVLPSPTFNQYQKRVFQGTRISEIEEIAEEFGEFIIPEQEFSFSDFALSLHYQPTPKHSIKASLVTAHNQLNYRVENLFDGVVLTDLLSQDNGGLSLGWTYTANKGHQTRLNLYSTQLTATYAGAYFELEEQDTLFAALSTNRITDLAAEFSQQWQLGKGHMIQGGYTWNALGLVLNFAQQQVGKEPSTEINEPGFITNAFFGRYRYEQPQTWWMDLSMRYVKYPLIPHFQLEPRLSTGWVITPTLQTRAYLGRYKQFISKLVLPLNEIGVGNQLWVLSHEGTVPLIRSNQAGLGLIYSQKGWQIEGEAYVKRLRGITTLSVLFEALPEESFSSGNAWIRGVDFLAKKRWNSYRTWMSYSLSKVQYNFSRLVDRSFPAPHDQRHTFSWAHVYETGPWEFSLGWNYSSGRPYTPLAGVQVQEEVNENNGNTKRFLQPLKGPINSRRLPAYHRLDVSTQFTFPLDPSAGWRCVLGISLLNVYNRANVLSRQFLPRELQPDEGEDAELIALEKLLLGCTPNVVVRLEW